MRLRLPRLLALVGPVALWGLGLQPLAIHAQSVDVMKYRAKPTGTPVFTDPSATTLRAYVNERLRSFSSCCGKEPIFVELYFNENGTVKNARAVTGKNECLTKSVVDVLKYIAWDLEDRAEPLSEPQIVEVPIDITCDPHDPYGNVYVPVPPPSGWVPESWGTKSRTDEPLSPNQPQPEGQGPRVAKASLPYQAPASTLPEAPLPFQPGTVSESTGQQSGTKAITSLLANVQDTLDTPVYQSKGELDPDDSHNDSHLDVTVTDAPTAQYKGGPEQQARYLRSAFKKGGLCGLVHVLAELTVEADGTISNVRILTVNSDDVYSAAKPILGSMPYNNPPHPMAGRPIRQYVNFEFKADISCTAEEWSSSGIDLESLNSYLQLQEGGQPAQEGELELTVPTDLPPGETPSTAAEAEAAQPTGLDVAIPQPREETPIPPADEDEGGK